MTHQAGAEFVGAEVTATDHRGLSLTTTTTSAGKYRFPALPPGIWAIDVTVADSPVARTEQVEIVLGRTLRVDFEIATAAVEEEIVVLASPSALDLESVADNWNLTADAFEELPRGRTFTQLVTLAPGVTADARSWGLSVDGASSSENTYIVDGAETTDVIDGGAFTVPQRRRLHSAQFTPFVDFLEEVQVKTAGYSAEFGGSTGGVISMITRSGTNRWKGDAVLYYQSDDFDGDARPVVSISEEDVTQVERVVHPKDSYDDWLPGASIGGPLRKDRLWMFAGYQPGNRTTRRATTFAGESTPTELTQQIEGDNATVNLNAQLHDQFQVRASYHQQDQKTTGLLPFDRENDTRSLEFYDKRGFKTSDTASLTVHGLASDRFFYGFRGGWNRGNVYDDNAVGQDAGYFFLTDNIGLPGVPEESQFPAFYSEGSEFSFPERRRREDLCAGRRQLSPRGPGRARDQGRRSVGRVEERAIARSHPGLPTLLGPEFRWSTRRIRVLPGVLQWQR